MRTEPKNTFTKTLINKMARDGANAEKEKREPTNSRY